MYSRCRMYRVCLSDRGEMGRHLSLIYVSTSQAAMGQASIRDAFLLGNSVAWECTVSEVSLCLGGNVGRTFPISISGELKSPW